MSASRPIYVLTLFLIAGLLLDAAPVHAETPLVEILKADPEWFGTVGKKKNALAVTFDVSGDPATLKSVSYRWEQEERRYAVKFKLDDSSVDFLIPPGGRNRWYQLVLTPDGSLWGSLEGLTKDRSRTFRQEVLLRPVGKAEARQEAATSSVLTLKGSAKHCDVPSGFQISDGKGLSPAQKRFLGFFSGYWDEKLHHTLLVEKIYEDGTVLGYYAVETYSPWKIHRPNCRRVKGKLDDGVLTVKLRSSTVVRYEFSGPDTLKGEYDRNNRVTPGTFKRQ